MTITNLAQYNNGGFRVAIYSDGTKIREKVSDVSPVFPESMDIKITDYCNLYNYCQWCHEGSSPEGTHADLDYLFERLKGLPAGIELALGGGNPLSHPNLIPFLEKVSSIGLIANITVNELHTKQFRDLIEKLINNNLVKGVGITYSGKEDLSWLHSLSDNVVYHVIAGIHKPQDIENLSKSLILGYKHIRKGINFYSEQVQQNIKEWSQQIRKYLGKNLISFDNLAIEQLNIRRFLTESAWEEFYMGDDGTFTFYLDAVKQEYALSSTSIERFRFDASVQKMFKNIINTYPV